MSDEPLSVAVLYNAPSLPPGHPDQASEADVVAVAEAIAASLAGAGFKVWEVAAARRWSSWSAGSTTRGPTSSLT